MVFVQDYKKKDYFFLSKIFVVLLNKEIKYSAILTS